jgi:hypothetical protein
MADRRPSDAHRTKSARSRRHRLAEIGRDTVIDKLVYAATNPVLDDLVDRVHLWPGGVP